ncbi:MAG TPA: hypothetical protein VF157_11725, partial [Chloroflexota bacterium]
MFARLWRCLAAAVALAGVSAGPASAAAPVLYRPAPVSMVAGPCRFVLGFAALHDLAPEAVGDCLENQAFAPNGDAVQHTTKGLLAWRKADNWTAFTNGYESWLNGPGGLVRRFNDEWFEWEAYPAETHGLAVKEDPLAPFSPSEVDLGPLLHVDQTMDNCGPAS